MSAKLIGLTDVQRQLYFTLFGQPEHVSVMTDDYGRLLADLRQAVAPLGYAVMRASLTTGLIDLTNDKKVREPSGNPLEILNALVELDRSAVVVIEDFHPYLTEQYPLIATRFREVAQLLKLKAAQAVKNKERPSVVIPITAGPERVIPKTLQASTVLFNYPLPTPPEIDEIIDSFIRKAQEKNIARVDSSDELRIALRNAVRGLSARAINLALAQAFARTGEISRGMLAYLYTERERQFETIAGGTGAQFILPPTDIQLAGHALFKNWVDRIAKALVSGDTTAEFTRGVLFAGPAGTGKTLMVMYLSQVLGIPIIMMSMGGMAGEGEGRVGSISGAMRSILSAAEACQPCILMWDEVMKDVDDPANAKRGGGTAEFARAIAQFQTWAETRSNQVIIAGTSNIEDFDTGLPAGFVERFPVQWATDKPDALQRCDIFSIELRKRRHPPASFDLVTLSERSEGWAGRQIRDVLIEAELIAGFLGEELTTEHVLQAIVEMTTNTRKIGKAGLMFRLTDIPKERLSLSADEDGALALFSNIA